MELKLNKYYIQFFNPNDAKFIHTIEEINEDHIICEVVNYPLNAIYTQAMLKKHFSFEGEYFFEIDASEYENARYYMLDIIRNRKELSEHINGLKYREQYID